MSKRSVSGVRVHKRKHGIAQKTGWCCAYCGEYLACRGCEPDAAIEDAHVSTVDHVRPYSLSGPNAVANLVLACGPCNMLKGDLIIDEPITREAIMAARRASGVPRDGLERRAEALTAFTGTLTYSLGELLAQRLSEPLHLDASTA